MYNRSLSFSVFFAIAILFSFNTIYALENHPFLTDVKEAYKSLHMEYNPKVQRFLFKKLSMPSDRVERSGLWSDLPISRNIEEKLILDQALEVMFSQFFRKVKIGGRYCPVDKIKKNFGESPEERIGISSGGYYRLFVAYWTLKSKLKEYHEINLGTYGYANIYYLDSIVTVVEHTVGGAFFPTPGPMDMPISMRRQEIEEMLKLFAPSMRIGELYEGADPKKAGWPILTE